MRLKMIAALVLFSTAAAFAHDPSHSELDDWFMGLKSGKGPCCSGKDGNVVIDADWESANGHYRVRMSDIWVDVPDDAVINGPNRDGRTIVWPTYLNGYPAVRCFMPGSMT